MTVLVTGATGLLGSHAVARLTEQGHAVRLLVRDPAKFARVPALCATSVTDVVVGDVTDRMSVERALDGRATGHQERLYLECVGLRCRSHHRDDRYPTD